MPPPATRSLSRQVPPRRPSKTSDAVLVTPAAPAEASSARAQYSKGSPAGALADITPTLDGNNSLTKSPADAQLPLRLPHAALTTANPKAMERLEPDLESNRLSFSSLYSLGSGIYNTVKGIAGSYEPSIADSEIEGDLVWFVESYNAC